MDTTLHFNGAVIDAVRERRRHHAKPTGRHIPGALATLCVAIAFVVASCAIAAAQEAQLEPEGRTPVQLVITPQTVLLRRPVTISGYTALDGKVPVVSIAITAPPGGTQQTLTPTEDKNGDFSTTFAKTDRVGKYTVTATSPSGRGTETADFTVVDYSGAVDQFIAQIQPTTDVICREKLEEWQSAFDSLPDSPPKREALNKLLAVREDCAKLLQQVAGITTARGNSPPPTPTPQPKKDLPPPPPQQQKALEVLPQITEQLKAGTAALGSRKASAVCDQLDRVVESLKFASLVTSVLTRGLALLNNVLFSAFVSPKVSAAVSATTPEGTTVVDQALKTSLLLAREASGSAQSVGEFRLGLLFDLAQYAGGKVFAAYCERFIGPFSATMHADLYSGGDVWWKYDIAIEGTLDLRYPKQAASAKVPLSGEFLGTATKFTIWENAITILYPKLARGAVLFRRTIPPVGTPYVPQLGKVPNGIQPNGFNIAVTGEFSKGKIVINLDKVFTDFKKDAVVVYVFVTAYTAGLPVVSSARLPYKDAHFLLMRAMDDKPVELEVKDGVSGKVMIAKKELKTEHGKPAQAMGRYTLKIEACNPECP